MGQDAHHVFVVDKWTWEYVLRADVNNIGPTHKVV